MPYPVGTLNVRATSNGDERIDAGTVTVTLAVLLKPLVVPVAGVLATAGAVGDEWEESAHADASRALPASTAAAAGTRTRAPNVRAR
ncbi:hypothetical protein tb265_25560 [Gemmatimonadetes bacterium T265]|nr:hypothetical protein tb265_25560 [Gemmatimonadetes bacterium T265]